MAQIPKKKFREMVFQIIYSQDFNDSIEPKGIFSMLDQCMISKKNMREAQERASKIAIHLKEIDEKIAQFSPEYDFSRISHVEKNILRLGIYEMIHDDDIPPKVAIAEAIRLARKYGTPEGGSFVNAVLDAIYVGKEHVSQVAN